MATTEPHQPVDSPETEEKKPISEKNDSKDELREQDLQKVSGGRMMDGRIP